ncbi:MAG: TAXI family TRAP transporter solute-binding subunit [Burkholderiales bacterium]|nr:TAXI family TRAP transporter solute-binding subunit [Burkholderiales bacterium]
MRDARPRCGAALAACAALLLLACSKSALAQAVSMAAGDPGSGQYAMAVVVAKLLNQRAGVTVSLKPYLAPRVSLPAINDGEIQFGFGDAAELAWAVQGEDSPAGRPQASLRAIAALYPLRPAIFVRQNAPIATIAALKGRPAVDGFGGQRLMLAVLDALYATAGLSRADIKAIPVPDAVAGAEAFAAGRSDMFLFTLGSARLSQIEARVGAIRMLALADGPDSSAALRRHFPWGYLRLERPGPGNTGVRGPGHVLAYDMLLISGATLAEELAYRVARTLHDGAAALADAHEPFRQFDPKAMARSAGPLSYHPGAMRYYRETGIWPAR